MSGIIAQNTLDNSGLIKSPAGGGAWNFISKQTASSSGDLSFTSGIDSTYREYIFTFNNMHPATSNVQFQFNFSIDSGSNYNVTKTTTIWKARHSEDDGNVELGYESGSDLAQSTSFQPFTYAGITNDNDSGLSGTFHVFAPSDTTFVKHFIARCNYFFHAPPAVAYDTFVAGYGNTTSAVDAIQFKMSSGDTDSGDICLYGITT
jgi:hypothetical protein